MIFTILCPNYAHNSAGVCCLWRLGNYLVDLGHEVQYINYQTNPLPPPEWSKMCKRPDNTTIGTIIAPEVFPEINVPHVRWCLNKPGLLGGPTKYPAGSKVFHFSPEIEESARKAAADGVSTPFMLGTIEPPTDICRGKDLTCWYRGKYGGPVAESFITGIDYVEVTRTWPPTKVQYHNILSRTSEFYSYDDFSAVNIEAHLAGCDVFVWDGSSFITYKPPEYANDLIINYDKELEATHRFVSCILGE
jgi:hypothetical protein